MHSKMRAMAPQQPQLPSDFVNSAVSAKVPNDSNEMSKMPARQDLLDYTSITRFPPASGLIPLLQDLSKSRLATLVTLTTMCGFALAPVGHSLPQLFWTTAGTALCIGAANSLNQWLEMPFDAQMLRTRNRALVRRRASPLMAVTLAAAMGTAGTAILALKVNAITAALGLGNIALYAAAYTPLKRLSVSNTWLGAVVGAIPPVMGWTACTGSIDMGALCLAWVLYAWQFPHFNSLAWLARRDYAHAGYCMLASSDFKWNARVALRYSIALLPISALVPLSGMTSWWFACDSSILNAYLVVNAARFWKHQNDKTARSLFFASLVHLPLVMGLMLLHKNNPVYLQ